MLHALRRGRDDHEVDDVALEDLSELVERSEHLARQLRGRRRAVEHEPGELVPPVRAREERLVQIEREVVGTDHRERPRVVPAAPRGARDEPDHDAAAAEQHPRDREVDADEEPRDVVLVQQEARGRDEQRLDADGTRHPEELAPDGARPVDVVHAGDRRGADPEEQRQGEERPVAGDRIQPRERCPGDTIAHGVRDRERDRDQREVHEAEPHRHGACLSLQHLLATPGDAHSTSALHRGKGTTRVRGPRRRLDPPVARCYSVAALSPPRPPTDAWVVVVNWNGAHLLGRAWTRSRGSPTRCTSSSWTTGRRTRARR